MRRAAIVLALLPASGAAWQQRLAPQSVEGRLKAPSAPGNPVLAEADAHYGRRAEGRIGARASPREIAEAIADYERAAEDPTSAEARWKLARALYFQGSYTGRDAEGQRAAFEEARRVSEEAVAILARRSGETQKHFLSLSIPARVRLLSRDRDAVPASFWAAVAWGQWALAAGKGEAARTRAATQIRYYARLVVALDPQFEEGGGYRILGRLHDRAPWIPFLTDWVSRREALHNLRLAVQVDARNFVNRHFLAEALASGGTAERSEAITIEEGLVADVPSPGHLVEEFAIQEEARRNLAAWRKTSP